MSERSLPFYERWLRLYFRRSRTCARSEAEARLRLQVEHEAHVERVLAVDERVHAAEAAVQHELPEEPRATGPADGPERDLEPDTAAETEVEGGAARHLTRLRLAEPEAHATARPEEELGDAAAVDAVDAGARPEERGATGHEGLALQAVEGDVALDAEVRALRPVAQGEPQAEAERRAPAGLVGVAHRGGDAEAPLLAEVVDLERHLTPVVLDALREHAVVVGEDQVAADALLVVQLEPGAVDVGVVAERVDVGLVDLEALDQPGVPGVPPRDDGALRTPDRAHGPLLAGADVARPSLLEPDARDQGLADAHRDLRAGGAGAGHVLEHLAPGDVVAVGPGGLALPAGGLGEHRAAEADGADADETGDETADLDETDLLHGALPRTVTNVDDWDSDDCCWQTKPSS